MREIKFRLWDKGLNEMYVLDCLNMPIERNLPVMQFTGLKDRNGVEIYEGDVVKDVINVLGFIDFKDGVFIINDNSTYCQSIISQHKAFGRIEVIGNIYENPELLKAEE